MTGTVLFDDSFASGDLTHTHGSYSWGSSNGDSGNAPVVSNDIARTGSTSLKFTYRGSASGDAWSEQRFKLGDNLTEIYLEWYQYFPDGTEGLGAKWTHRFVTGPDNNKFLRVWDDDYVSYKIKVGHSWDSSGDPEKEACITEHAVNASGMTKHGPSWSPSPFDGADDTYLGRWIRFRSHVKTASSANNDGVIQLWVDDTLEIDGQVHAIYPSGGVGNYFANLYFNGWANSGFASLTHTYIDDVVISSIGFIEMAKDFDSLKTALKNDPRYDAAVVSGNNGEVTRLLNELEFEQTVITDISRRVALKAFKDAVRTLTQLQVDRLKLVMGEGESIATSDPDIRAEIVDIFGSGSPAVTRLSAAATRDATYGDAFGYPNVGINVVRRAVRLIAKSFIVSTGQV